MSGERWLRAVNLLTNLAHPLVEVNPPVLAQGRPGREAAVAVCAGVRPGARVRVEVTVESPPRPELFAAGGALFDG